MEKIKKIESLNIYELISKFLQRSGITSHISKHLSSVTMKPVDSVFASVLYLFVLCFLRINKAGNAGLKNNIEFVPKRQYYLFGLGDNSFNQLGMKQINQFNNTISKPRKICCNNFFGNYFKKRKSKN